MNPEQSVLDEIDRLVDESLATPYSERSGYDNDINQPECRCGADWHGLPKGGCPGSDAEGPVARATRTRSRWPGIDADAARRFAELFAGMPYRYANGGAVNEAFEAEPGEYAEAPYLGSLADGDRVAYEINGRVITGVVSNHQIRGNVTSFDFTPERGDSLVAWQIPDLPWLGDEHEEPETPQQRALPQPSTTPPMWAARADGRRRR